MFVFLLLCYQFVCYDALDNAWNAHSCLHCVCPVVFSTIHVQRVAVYDNNEECCSSHEHLSYYNRA